MTAKEAGSDLFTPADQGKGLFWLGLILTACWFVVGALVIAFLSDLSAWPKPNDWGDIFAGFSAPVAFLWLVLGFLQQGHELRLSTQALRLQVAELNASVEQQRELVEVTRQQVLATLSEQERKKVLDEAATQPRFVVKPGGSASNAGSTIYDFELVNEGETVTNVSLSFTPTPDNQPSSFFASLRRAESAKFKIRYGGAFPEAMAVDISFDDIHLARGEDHFIATIVSTGPDSKAMRITRRPV